MAGGGVNSPVVAVKLTGASQSMSDSWTDSKLLSGDVVLQVGPLPARSQMMQMSRTI